MVADLPSKASHQWVTSTSVFVQAETIEEAQAKFDDWVDQNNSGSGDIVVMEDNTSFENIDLDGVADQPPRQ